MSLQTRRTWTLFRAIVYEARAENLTFMAGSIAYNAFVSLLPLLLLLLGIISTVGNSSLEKGLIDLMRAVLTPGTSEVLVAELLRSSASASVSLIGGAFLLWGTLRIFWGLDTAFSVIYESEAKNTFADHVIDGLFVLITITLAIIAAVVIESEVSSIATGTLGWTVHRLALVAGLVISFIPMYYVFPDQEDMSVFEVIPGVLIASVGLTTLESLIRFYVTFSSQSPTQNIIVAFLVLLMWLYFSGFVILLGAVVNVVTSNRSRDVNVRPLITGISLEENESLPDRKEFLSKLERLDQRSESIEKILVSFDEEETLLPSPDAITVDRGESKILFGTGPIKFELYWSPPETI